MARRAPHQPSSRPPSRQAFKPPRLLLSFAAITGLVLAVSCFEHLRTVAAQGSQSTFDVLITGGRIVDGSGAPWFAADIGISGDRIRRVGDLSGATATRRIDARGLIVAPGFVDAHAHARERLFDLPTADGYVRQGVTTVVDGNDGSSPLPLAPYFEKAAAARFATNLALFVGHGTVRERVMGTVNRYASPQELDRMKALVADAMREGALGLSTGLAYIPGTYAATEELIALAAVARTHGGIYVSHMRDEGGRVLDSVRETIRIGEEARIPVQISHHKVGGRRQFGQSVQSLQLIAAARARGIDVTFDQYPYTASQTGLTLIFPAWAMADDSLRKRLSTPSSRAEVKSGMLAFIDERFGDDPSRIQLVRCGFDPSLSGKTIADLLKAASLPLTQSATADVVIDLQLKGGCSAIFHAYDEPDVVRLMQSPFGMIASDGSLTALGDGSPHPRAFGTFPRVLGRYVREQHVISIEEAVRKMTSFPAARLGLQDRGLLREGLAADITIFDPATIVDRATFTDPHHYSEGVRWVLVNGEVVLDAGAHTGARPGRVLRRTEARSSSVPPQRSATAEPLPTQRPPTRADILRGEYGPYRANNDLLFYHLDVRVDPERKSITGTNTIRFKMLQDATRIQLDLYANLTVDKILLGAARSEGTPSGVPLKYTRELNAVFVDFPTMLRAGEVHTIAFHYSGMPQEQGRFGGMAFRTDPAGRHWINTACEGEGSSVWWPSKDQWRDEPESMDLSVAIPNNLVDVSNGRFIGKTDLGDGYTRWDWRVHYRINNGYKAKVQNREPIVTQRGIHRSPPADQYFKGALFLNTLRSVVNDDARWWNAIRDFYQRFKYQNIMTEDVVRFFNAALGQDLTPIFDQYLHRTAIPTLELAFNQSEGMVAHRWRADERAFAMPIRVGVPGKWQTITPTTDWKRMPMSMPKDRFEVATDLYYVNVKTF